MTEPPGTRRAASIKHVPHACDKIRATHLSPLAVFQALERPMDNPITRITDFVKYVRTHLTGDEKGEAQIFCDRLFQAFGHQGIREAGGTLEFRIHKGKGTKFADLLWRPRLLLEMKKRDEKLQRHYRQAFEYWLNAVPNRPEYVVLCNFDEFWIYEPGKMRRVAA